MMRRTVLICLLVVLGTYCFAQQGPAGEMQQNKVRITNWKRTVYRFAPDYWDNKQQDEIVAKIGQEEFEKMKAFADKPVVPAEMSMISGKARKDSVAQSERLNRLNIYRIATYTHVSKSGKVFEMAVLHVPYEENRAWDDQVKWGPLYFFIENRFVEEMQK
ncbi:hypothetical protein GFS24_12015 [Chitinophaga sp. SYP-B3965]|uniref:hypothetical protein n=1 Tax=Chitinophaga sp. SYP-B3965 TaxID=2663120 RepID=UPI001299F882|nr:hypothetical protein [Chitinophaga sp. SYP-B3965]MRG45845.1 hypothetical protein [Chitinophaga sp. SYP-B3965]